MSAIHRAALAKRDARKLGEQITACRGHLVDLLALIDEADREQRDELPQDRQVTSDDVRRLARRALLELGYDPEHPDAALPRFVAGRIANQPPGCERPFGVYDRQAGSFDPSPGSKRTLVEAQDAAAALNAPNDWETPAGRQPTLDEVNQSILDRRAHACSS